MEEEFGRLERLGEGGGGGGGVLAGEEGRVGGGLGGRGEHLEQDQFEE